MDFDIFLLPDHSEEKVSIRPTTASKHDSSVSTGAIVSESSINLRNNPSGQIQNIERQQQIEVVATYYAEQRGINSGFEVQDWLKAEEEIDSTE